MFDNDWIQADFDMLEQQRQQEKQARKLRRKQHKEQMLQQGFVPCSQCNGTGQVSKAEGRILYPRTNIMNKINRTCPVCDGKRFVKSLD